MNHQRLFAVAALAAFAGAPLVVCACNLPQKAGPDGSPDTPSATSTSTVTAAAVTTAPSGSPAPSTTTPTPHPMPVHGSDGGAPSVGDAGRGTWPIPSGFPSTLPPIPSGFPKTLPSVFPSGWPQPIPSQWPPPPH